MQLRITILATYSRNSYFQKKQAKYSQFPLLVDGKRPVGWCSVIAGDGTTQLPPGLQLFLAELHFSLCIFLN